MKKNLFYFMMLFVALGFMVSCDDDDDPEVIDNPVYGMQVIGTATDGKALVIDKSQMVEPSSSWEVKSVREGMYYGIYYLTAGELSFKEVTATSEVIYGISEVAETTQTAEAENAFTFSRGNLVVDGTETFNIASEGLYYIMTDKTSETFWVMKINSFLISTIEDEATMVSGSAAGAVYEILGADVRGEFKVKINSAWKIIADDILYGGTEYPEDGIRPIISFGGALNALTFDGSEIPFTPIAGHLTDFTFNWDPSKKGIAGITITTADAGEKVPTDYSDYLLGFIGNAVTVADTSWGWGNESYENKLPTKDGLLYTWTWTNVSIADTTGGRTWKFRKDNAWTFTLGFENVTMSGSASSDFFKASNDGNFGIGTSKVYDMILTVNADNDVWTLGVAEAGGATYDIWGLIGDATPGGWGADTEMTPNEDGTEWTWTGNLASVPATETTEAKDGEFKFRANGSWDSQIGDDGAGGAEFSSNAASWKITAAEAGNYTIVLNSVTPSMTITKNSK
ncbi:MAG: SusF/SusE family outer membrane protein [Bacteroidales bacterium]|jgi:hypothetical protein|nr:SusF/SusE family outer membrane protein [Bacteroidales bacterium]